MKSFERNLRLKIKDGFKQHTLRMVLTRIDFAPLFGFEVIAAEYQKKFLSDFPEATIENEAGYDIDMSNLKDPKVLLREHNQVFALSNTSEKKKIKFAPNSLILEHHKYVDFDSFSREFSNIGNFIFSNQQSVFSPTRLGLRKINTLVLTEGTSLEDFKDYFSGALLSHLNLPFLNKSLTVDKHIMTFSLPEEKLNINLQFSSERGRKDNQDSRRFILDLDAYSTELPKDLAECYKVLANMNDLIFDLFWFLIGPKTEQYLKGE